MAVKIAGGIQTAVERAKEAVKHVAGAMGSRMVKSKDEAVSFGTQFENSLKRWAGDVVLRPDPELGDLLHKATGMIRMIDVPYALLDSLKSIFEMLPA